MLSRFFGRLWFAMTEGLSLAYFLWQAAPHAYIRRHFSEELSWTKQVLAYLAVMQYGGEFYRSINGAQQVAVDVLVSRGYKYVPTGKHEDTNGQGAFETFKLELPSEDDYVTENPVATPSTS